MPTPPAAGDAAARLALPDLDGEVHSLAGLGGGAVLVSFLRHAG